jgi:hypothetical protein
LRNEAQQQCRLRRKNLLPAIRNLIEALDRLHEDLDRVELWTAALGCFLHPAPEYEPGARYMLPPLGQPGPQRPGR